MANERFTPGPWEVTTGTHNESTDLYDKGEAWFNVNGEGGVIADVLHGRCLSADEDEAAANAALIAAAPVMYEALNAAYAALQECVPFPHHPDPGAIEDIKAQIREALAAANPETINT